MRIATDDDLDAVVETIALAFRDDPIWAPALARPDGSTAHHESSAAAMFELWDRFEAGRSVQPPHAYLDLLATHPDHRGRGISAVLDDAVVTTMWRPAP